MVTRILISLLLIFILLAILIIYHFIQIKRHEQLKNKNIGLKKISRKSNCAIVLFIILIFLAFWYCQYIGYPWDHISVIVAFILVAFLARLCFSFVRALRWTIGQTLDQRAIKLIQFNMQHNAGILFY